jgi:Na+-translocating ferredoxin:NAD+ oxidoreductase subunit D
MMALMLRRPANILDPSPLARGGTLELKAPRRRAMGSVIGHTGFNVARYHTTHVFGALFPLLAGSLFFGWRAVLAVILVIAATLLSGLVWRRIGARGHSLRPAQLLWLGLVIALMLPARLMRLSDLSAWPILVAAGLSITILCWAFGAIGSGRFHPAVVVYLLIALLYHQQLRTDSVMQRNRLLLGDVLAVPRVVHAKASQFTWRKRSIEPGYDAAYCPAPSRSLQNFTHPDPAANLPTISLDTLVRDRLPPLEDVVLGAIPGGIGVTSAVAVIIGGLFLLYRGLIDFRIPLLMTASAWFTLLLLPIHHLASGRWFPGHTAGVGWAMSVTLVNYEVLASPLLFTAFFLAGSPSVRPLTKKGRTLYALSLGVLTAVFQMYFSVSIGSYLALLLAGFTTPVLDRYLRSRPLV